MMFKISGAVALATLALASTAANATDTQATGFYGGLNLGIADLNHAKVTYYDAGGTFGGSGAEDTLTARFDFKKALTFGGVLGYDFGMVRTDLEVSYARNRIRSVTIQDVNGTPITLDAADRADICDFLETTCGGSGNTFTLDGGRARQLNALGNVWVDLPVGGITPYIGGGLGVSGFEVDGDGKAKFAWQVGAGVAFNVAPAVALTLDFRHRQAGKTSIAYDDTSGLRIGSLKTNSYTAGVRFYFGGAPAPAPAYAAPPAPMPAPVVVPTPEPMAPPPPPPPPAAAPGERG